MLVQLVSGNMNKYLASPEIERKQFGNQNYCKDTVHYITTMMMMYVSLRSFMFSCLTLSLHFTCTV